VSQSPKSEEEPDRHPRPARTFEVVVGQIRGAGDAATRFAFVRRGSAAGAATITQALREHGVNQDTRVTVLCDGDAGLRAIQRAVAPEADPVLDWFHIAMRWQHVHQLATGAMHHGQNAEARTWLLDGIERTKWALWNGRLMKTLRHLSDLRVWTWNARADPSWLEHLRTHLSELTYYLDANAHSLPNYGARYRAGQPISTAFAESAVNQIIAKRMIKRQQMRWNRETVPPFLTVRVHVLNDTLKQAVPVLAHRLQTARESSRVLRGVSTPLDCMLSRGGGWSGGLAWRVVLASPFYGRRCQLSAALNLDDPFHAIIAHSAHFTEAPD
jgi:hypothetical protein